MSLFPQKRNHHARRASFLGRRFVACGIPQAHLHRGGWMLIPLSQQLRTGHEAKATCMFNWANAWYMHTSQSGRKPSWASEARGASAHPPSNLWPPDPAS